MSKDSIPSLIEAFREYKINPVVTEKNLCHQLDEFSKAFARDQAFRLTFVTIFTSVWECISDLWDTVLPDSSGNPIPHDLTLSLSRFTRNLVAHVPSNQHHAVFNESKIRLILHHLTSFFQLEQSNSYTLTRMLTQTISNIVTLNDVLATRLWILYTTLSEEQNIITRLLSSPDTLTVIATLVLISNCINSEEEKLSRLISPIGLRIVVRLLDRTEEWAARDDEDSDENEAFNIAYRIFEALLRHNLGANLYQSLSIEDEPITPHQTTFLKIIDSNLRNRDEHFTADSNHNDYVFLVESFFDLCSYSQLAIRRSLGIESAVPLQPMRQFPSLAQDSHGESLKELDMRLPRVSAALILLSECLTTISLQDQAYGGETHTRNDVGYNDVVKATLRDGFVENLVETLQLVDRFLPRIVFGRAIPVRGEPSLPPASTMVTTGFAYLKRNLVRLLGIICYERKHIQDRIRGCGGIPVIMNLCVIDERNPYLQEHALFTLRNLLHCNPENQAVVEAIKLEHR